MPRAKKVQEVPVEILNQIGNALNGAMASISNISYAHVMMLDETVREQISMTAMSINTAIKVFHKTYIDKSKPAQPAPRRNTLKPLRKPKVHSAPERVDQGGNSHEE